jgi:carbon monoxide dehydrogenase subunit G
MPSYTQTIEVAADPDTAWQVLGDLAGVDRWIPGVTMVEVAGLTRRCTFADGHTQREEILDYSPATRSYRYTIDGGLPVRDNRGRFAVEPAGTGTRIVWESSFEALDPTAEDELGRMWAGMLPIVLANLRTVIEHGSGADQIRGTASASRPESR